MKKIETKDRLPDIPAWVNSGRRRAVHPGKCWEVHEELPKAEAEPKIKKSHAWVMVGIATVLFAVAAGCGAYVGGIATNSCTYIVKPGETVWDIAKHTVGEAEDARKVYYQIMKDNGIGEDAVIHPGQQLIIKR